MDETVSKEFRWLILFAMVLVTAAAAIFLVAPATLLGQFFTALPGLKPQQITFITMGGYFQFFMYLAMLPGGLLLDRFGALKIYIAGLVLIGIGGLLMPVFGTSYSGMLFLRTLQALGIGPVLMSSIPIAARYFPEALRTAVIVVQSVAMGGSIIIGIFLSNKIAQSTGSPQSVLAWLAVLVILPGLILSIVAAVLDRRHQTISDENKFIEMDRIRHALSQHAIWVVLACLAMATWISSSMGVLFEGYFESGMPFGLGFAPSIYGRLVTTAGVFRIFGMIIGVILTEMIFKGNIRPVVLTGFVIPAIFILLIKGSNAETSHWVLWCYVLATYFTMAFVTPQLLGYIAKNCPANITGALGGLAMCIAGFIGTAADKVVHRPLHYSRYSLFKIGYPLSFKILVGVAVLGIIFILFLGPEKERA